MDTVLTAFAKHMDAIVVDLRDRVLAIGIEPYTSIPPEQLRQMIHHVISTFQHGLTETTPQQFPAYWVAVAKPRAEQGFPIVSMLQIIDLGMNTLDAYMTRALHDDAAAYVWWERKLRVIIFSGIHALSQAYVSANAQIINNQASQLRALATPIVPVYSGILVLPLVGEVDTMRANQIMEALLEAIVRTQAEVVLIDVTGVPVVDTQVANYILQIARAAKLLGTMIMLVGISAEIAQTIVHLGVELGDLVTRSNLQSGIEYALLLQGRAILPIRAQE